MLWIAFKNENKLEFFCLIFGRFVWEVFCLGERDNGIRIAGREVLKFFSYMCIFIWIIITSFLGPFMEQLSGGILRFDSST